jgi:hypothetical protein
MVLGAIGFLGGSPVLTAYLFFASLAAKGDAKELLLGNATANR